MSLFTEPPEDPGTINLQPVPSPAPIKNSKHIPNILRRSKITLKQSAPPTQTQTRAPQTPIQTSKISDPPQKKQFILNILHRKKK